MTRLYEMWPPAAFYFKNAIDWIDPAHAGLDLIKGATKANPNPSNAIDSLPVPTPQAPITAADPEVIAAEDDYTRAQLQKFGINKTVFAGNTMGYKPGEAGQPGTPGAAPATFKV